MFVNEREFKKPESRQWAMGVDTRPSSAIVDTKGKVLVRPQTGGMISPMRYEIKPGTVLYRFAAKSTPLNKAITGGWWVEQREFARLESFAQAKGVHVAMASRVLCAVPPEWSDMGLLLKVKVKEPLLAFRGLGNNVVVPKNDGLGDVKMKVDNNNSARRLHQLFVPGLAEFAAKTPHQVMPGALSLENHWKLDTNETRRGWLYV